MNWLIGLYTLVVGINLHALTGLVISRGKATLALRRLARRSGWLTLG